MDYKYQNHTFRFDEGDKIKELSFIPINDNIVEADETCNLTIRILTLHDHVVIGENHTATFTVNNDDGKYVSIININKR